MVGRLRACHFIQIQKFAFESFWFALFEKEMARIAFSILESPLTHANSYNMWSLILEGLQMAWMIHKM